MREFPEVEIPEKKKKLFSIFKRLFFPFFHKIGSSFFFFVPKTFILISDMKFRLGCKNGNKNKLFKGQNIVLRGERNKKTILGFFFN